MLARPLFLLLLALSILAASAPARAATTLTVTTTADAGAGSLRQAVTDAAAGDTIVFQTGLAGTITLTSGALPTISQDLTIAGPGAGALAVDGNHASRVFAITGGTVALSGLTVQNGQSPNNASQLSGVGGGVGIDGGTVTLTACAFIGNTAPDGGGGVYNGTGNVILTDCTFQANVSGGGGALAGIGGGMDSQDGTLALTRCTFVGNSADFGGGLHVDNYASASAQSCTFNGNRAGRGGGGADTGYGVTLDLTNCVFTGNVATGGDGGGVLNSAAVTLTSCTLSDNTASNGTGGGIANSFNSGPAVLVNDIVYDNRSPVSGGSELGGTGFTQQFSVAYCDIPYYPVAPDSHIISADPLFVRPAGTNGTSDYGDLHLQAGSPCIGAGTSVAGVTTDRDGRPYFTPPALGAYEGPRVVATDTHVLWDNPDGRTIFWDVNAQGAYLIAGDYAPLTDPNGSGGYTARAQSTGPDGVSHLLWAAPDGRTSLWSVHADGSYTPFGYGPFSDDGTPETTWQPVAVSTGGDNVSHVLWRNPNGRTILWDVLGDGSFTVAGDYGGFSDDGTYQTLWKAQAVASGPDGRSHLLWTNPDGRTLLWDLDAQDRPTPHDYPAFSDDGTAATVWQARALSVGPDGTGRVLWNNPNGRTILWEVLGDGSFTVAGDYGPYQDDASGNTGYTAVALATGGDGLSHFAWDNPDGDSFLWSVQPDGTHADTFFPPFYDGVNAWKAVAVSAAEPGLAQ